VQKLKAISDKPYKEQAQYFLNAFWVGTEYDTADGPGPDFAHNEENCELVWAYKNAFVELDKKDEAGNELDEFQAHVILEKYDSALTVTKMREVLSEIDVDFNKMVSLTEYLIYKFGVKWVRLVNAPQGGEDAAAVAQAQKLVDAAKEKMQEVADAAKAAQEAADASKAEAAKAAEAAAASAEAQKAAEAAQADAEKAAAVEAQGEDMSLGIVKRNRAKNEAAQMRASDPQPLRTARINQGATVRKLARAQKKAEATAAAAAEATAVAAAARAQADAAQAAAEAAAADAQAAADEAEAAIPVAEEAFNKAIEELEVVKATAKTAGQGTFWWMDRELIEAMKFMPQKKAAKMMAEMQARKAARAGGGGGE